MISLGEDYERQATHWLEDQGMQLLARNFRGKTGEIDIIARDGEHLVFLEVRARSNRAFNSAAGSVDRRKQSRLIACAQYFMQTHPDSCQQPCRFDVISITGSTAAIEWIANAFAASE